MHVKLWQRLRLLLLLFSWKAARCEQVCAYFLIFFSCLQLAALRWLDRPIKLQYLGTYVRLATCSDAMNAWAECVAERSACRMATAAGSSAESEALRLAFSYLVNSIDSTSVLPAALSAHLISDSQRSECASEAAPFKKAEKFLGQLQRSVNGDSKKYHTFIQVLRETGQASIASRLQG